MHRRHELIFYGNECTFDGEKCGGGDTAGDGGGEKSVRMSSGVATIKRDVKASFLGADYSGIMAEYIVVGTFTGTRRN